MKVNFTQPFGQAGHHLLENGLRHSLRLSQPENPVGKLHSLGEKRGFSRTTQKMKNSTDQRSRGGFSHQTHRSKPSLSSDGKPETKDRRMKMQMEVTVPISGRQIKGEKAIKLTSNSSPGPGGICFAAWRALGPLGHGILRDALLAMAADDGPQGMFSEYDTFNESLFFFLLKNKYFLFIHDLNGFGVQAPNRFCQMANFRKLNLKYCKLATKY